MKYFLFTMSLSVLVFKLWGQDEPGYTVEAYYTDTEIKAANREFQSFLDSIHLLFIENHKRLWNRYLQGEISEPTLRELEVQLADEQYMALKNRHIELEAELFSGIYQKLLYDEEVYDEDWGNDEPEQPMDDWADFDWSLSSPKIKRNKFSALFAFGWLSLQNRPYFFPETNFWRSGMVEFGFFHQMRLNKVDTNAPWQWTNGLTFVQNSVRWRGNEYIIDGDFPTFASFDRPLRRNDFSVAYIVYSTGLGYRAPGKKKFYADLMGFVGYSVYRESQIRYKNEGRSGRTTQYTSGDFGVNRLCYGMTASIGIKNLVLYSRYDFSSLFRESRDVLANPWSIGVRIF